MVSPTVDRRYGVIGSAAIKVPCDCATTANITLSGEQTIDGILTSGSRVLVKNQTDATTNGIYTSNTGAWSRSLDFDGPYDITDGTLVMVNGGALNSSLLFELVSANPITIGTSALTFSSAVVNNATYISASDGSSGSLFTTVQGFITKILSSSGSSLVGFIQSGTGAVSRTVQDMLRVTVNVFQFMTAAQIADVQAGTLSIDCLASFNAALTKLQADTGGGIYRGGKLEIPAGAYKMSGTFAIAPNGAYMNIVIEGAGIENTVLDFSTAAVVSDGVEFTAGAYSKISKLTIQGAKQDGLVMGTAPAAAYLQWFTVEDVRLTGCGRNGFSSTNSYGGRLHRVNADTNSNSGFVFNGFHTSLDVANCEAYSNSVDGWVINNVTYSSFQACGSDSNRFGYAVSGARGLVFDACGAESNSREGWYVYSSTAVGATSQLAFKNCQGYWNNFSLGAYGSFIAVNTADSMPISLTMDGCGSTLNSGQYVAVYLNGTSGAITYREIMPNHDSVAGHANYVFTGIVNTGDYVSATLSSASAVALTSGVIADVITGGLTLPAGDWYVKGIVNFVPGINTSITVIESGIGLVAATFGAENTLIANRFAAVVLSAGNNINHVTPQVIVRSDGTTKVYLVTVAGFTVSTLSVFGKIYASRA